MALYAQAILDGKNGFVDTNNTFVEAPGKAWNGKGPLRLVKGEGGYGFVDVNMDWKIEPTLDLANKIFHEGLCRIKKDGKYGFIDLEGNVVIEPKFAASKFCQNGFIPASEEGKKYGYLTASGDWITKQRYTKPSKYFKNGCAAVQVGKKWGYINSDGKEFIKPRFTDEYGVSEFGEDGIIRGQIGRNAKQRFEFLNNQGDVILDGLSWANEFSEGLGFGWTDGDNGSVKPSFYDTAGKIVKSTEGLSLDSQVFSEGLVAGGPSGPELNYGYLNTKFEQVIEPQFRHTYPFKNGFAMVGNTDWKWTYVNREGKVLTDYTFDLHQPLGNYKPRDFSTDGRCVVFVDGKFSFIDESGKTIVPFNLEVASDFHNGYCIGRIEGKWGAYDIAGKIVVPFEYDSLALFNPFE